MTQVEIKARIFNRLVPVVLFSAAVILASCSQKAEKEEVPVLPTEKDHIEEVLETLNQSLEENKKLKDSLEVVQLGLQNMTVENNVLRSQVRTLEKRMGSTGEKQDKMVDELRVKQVMTDELQEELKAVQSKNAELKNEVQKLTSEKEELVKVLDTAILQREADEYRRLIDAARVQAENAMQQMAERNKENEKLRLLLSGVNYRLGTVMFEIKNYEGALRYLKDALEWNPSNSWAHHNLAVIYDFYLEDHALAVNHYKEYLDLKPLEEEAAQIRERILDLELVRKVIPTQPLKMDFNKYHSEK